MENRARSQAMPMSSNPSKGGRHDFHFKDGTVPINPLLKQFFGNQIPDQERKEEGLGSA